MSHNALERREIIREARSKVELLKIKLEALVDLEEQITAISQEGSHETMAERTSKDDRGSFGINSF